MFFSQTHKHICPSTIHSWAFLLSDLWHKCFLTCFWLQIGITNAMRVSLSCQILFIFSDLSPKTCWHAIAANGWVQVSWYLHRWHLFLNVKQWLFEMIVYLSQIVVRKIIVFSWQELFGVLCLFIHFLLAAFLHLKYQKNHLYCYHTIKRAVWNGREYVGTVVVQLCCGQNQAMKRLARNDMLTKASQMKDPQIS